MSKVITYQQLLDKEACFQQRLLFKKLFGTQVELTESLVLEHYQRFDIPWAVRNLLSPTALAEHNKVCGSAWAECKKVRDSAWAEYKKVRDSAWAEYEKVQSSALAEYKKVQSSALAEYEKVQSSALAECEKVCALSFFNNYN